MKKGFKKFFKQNGSVFLKAGVTVLLVLIVFIPFAVHAQTPPSGGNGSGIFGIGSFTADAINTLLGWILTIIMSLIAGLLLLAGLILDYVIKLSIVDLAANLAKITGIDVTWRLIRDLCNMSFIFILLYNGIMTIFTGENKAKKIIVPVIIAALLINFSLFFTKLIIDASNIITISFYNSIAQSAGAYTFTANNAAGSLSFSGAFMKSLNLASLYSSKVVIPPAPGTYVVMVVGSSIFMLIAAFIFLAMAVLFLIRYIVFILLLIISPLGYMASVIPGLKSISEKYWGTLLGQAYFAPIFMIMTWITLTLASSLTSVAGVNGDMQAAFTNPGASSIGVLVNFLILTGFLIATIIVSKTYATRGGIVSTKIINAGTAMLGGAVFGGAAMVGRNTIGKYANTKANDEELKAKAAAGNRLAQLQLKTARYGAKSTFDARRSVAGEQIQKATGTDFGKGLLPFEKERGKGGYEQRLKDKKESEKKYAESLKPSDEAEAAAKEKLKNMKVDVAEEKAKKEIHLRELDEEIKKYKELDSFDRVDAERKKAEQEADRLLVEKLAAEKRMRDYQDTLATVPASDQSRKSFLERQIKSEQDNAAKLGESLTKAKEVLAEKNKILEKVDELMQTRTKDERNWVSPELRETIAAAGGSKVNIDSAVIKALGISKENKNEDTIQSAKNERIEAYAKNLETAKTWARAWISTPKINKQAAVEVRKAAKGKSAEQELKDIAKKLAKEKGEKLDDEVETPPTPATPPPTTP